MDSVKEVAITFCAAAIFVSAVGLLSGKALEKSSRYIIALILLCTLISSVAKGDFSLSFPEIQNEEVSSTTVVEVSLYQAEYIIGEILKNNTVKFSNVSVTANKNTDDGIIINEITIEGAQDVKKAEAVLKASGIDCEVVFR